MNKNLTITAIFLLLGINSVFSQKIFVENSEIGYEQPIVNLLLSENYKITLKRDSADYELKCLVSKTGLGRARGSVAIIDNKTGDLIAKTKEVKGQTAMTNGYANPKIVVMRKIANKYLVTLLEEYLLQ